MIGIGIDTGGTYTDAVIYHIEKKQILSSGKALTTKENLETGILNAMKKLSQDYIKEADFIALSTTLATNACVESKGGRARLMFIGVDPVSAETVRSSYGLPPMEELYFLNGDAAYPETRPDWEKFRKDLAQEFAGFDSAAIVQIHPKANNGQYEKQAREILQQTFDIPCICGYELFHDVNVLRRGASSLLNARLLPVMKDFFDSIHRALKKLDLSLPIVVVRSDGSLMSQEFACERPVETLLCGPAASVMGSMELSGETNGIIVDMGGTTSDISLFTNHTPVTVRDGIQIGSWKTFVKGLYVDTFGLGGDSAVRYEQGRLFLDTERVVPLCSLASQYPQAVEQLMELEKEERSHSHFLHEFFLLVHPPAENHSYTETELAFCQALKEGPLILEKAARAIGKDVYTLNVSRLEREGLVIRCGLTPTDIMHIRGDFVAFHAEASRLGAAFMARSTGISLEQLCEKVYSLVQKKLYCNLGRILMENQNPALLATMGRKGLDAFLAASYEQAVSGSSPTLLRSVISTDYTLIGIGAPIHLFVKEVAELLGTQAVVPDYAPVANALGAVVGNVSATWTVEICPVYDSAGITGYEVITTKGTLSFEEEEPARQAAIKEAMDAAAEEARKRGAKGDLTVSYEIITSRAAVGESDLLLNEKVIGKAVGRMFSTEA